MKRTSQGRFKEMDDVGRSQNATTVKSGYGDQGDERKKHGAVRLRLGRSCHGPRQFVRADSDDPHGSFPPPVILLERLLRLSAVFIACAVVIAFF